MRSPATKRTTEMGSRMQEGNFEFLGEAAAKFQGRI